ncbi:MAG TPA: aldose epimerase [Firmicutes bacterium]|nr:aldose epimerase [Bacillota bacterium]
MICAQNSKIKLTVAKNGAEIKSIKQIENGLEYMWQANPNVWGRTAPVLFPIVGRLSEDTFLHNGVAYHMSQHGFARDTAFELVQQSDEILVFEMKSNDKTRAMYPFDFIFQIKYELVENEVLVTWRVVNDGLEPMYFSIGAHPGFNIHLSENDVLTDYYLHFKDSDGVSTLLFNQQTGRVYKDKETIIEGLKLLPLSADLFAEYGALIIDGETEITLASYEHDHEVKVSFEGFPLVGIWTAVNEKGVAGEFVCIEPWFGHGDDVEAPQELKDKKGIQTLESSQVFEATYRMMFK